VSTVDRILERNARYASGFTGQDLPAEPSLRLAVVTCMDARLETGRLLGLAEGEAHVIRNAGGVVTEDALRSLTISQRLLGTREVMVVLHTGCGMLGFRGPELAERIEAETGLRPPFDFGTFEDLEEEVRRGVARVRGCAFLPHRDAVRGFVVDLETGRLREVA